jgi:hypothetical protein
MTTQTTDHSALLQYESQVLAQLQPEAEDPVIDEMERDQASQPEATKPPAQEQSAVRSEPDKGDVRAALRASRHAERQSRAYAERLEAEVATLREQSGSTESEQEPQDDDIQQALARLELDVPQAAVVVRALAKKVDSLIAQRAAAPEAEPAPEFMPETLPAQLQDVVDDIPELLTWQTTQGGQDRWQMAKATDALLFKHPAWRDKPAAERMTEVVRRVNAEMGTPEKPTPKPTTARQASATAPTRGISTLSDLRGGGIPQNSTDPDFHRMKSDQEIMAALTRLG